MKSKKRLHKFGQLFLLLIYVFGLLSWAYLGWNYFKIALCLFFIMWSHSLLEKDTNS